MTATSVYKTAGTRKNKVQKVTPQTVRANKREVKNSAGGFVFKTGKLEQFKRFLILGTEGGTYYATPQDITKTNVTNMRKVFKEYGTEAVDLIVDVSVNNRAPKVQPALFALAVASSDDRKDVREAAFAAIPKVCRTYTHLATYVSYVKTFRGLGTGITKAIARWYTDRPVDSVAYQAVKYRNREGWTHRDMLRIAHPKTTEADRKELFNYLCDRPAEVLPDVVTGFEKAQAATTAKQLVKVLKDYNLPWEAVPTHFHNEAEVWGTLIEQNQLGLTALIRQLGRLTNLGVTKTHHKQIKALLTSSESLQKARVHPLTILNALMNYKSGMGRSGATWTPDRRVIDLLDEAFYESIKFVEPTGKRLLLALDVSGSMGARIANMNLSCREASAALALVTAKSEEDYEIVGFTSGGSGYSWRSAALTELDISPRQRLDDAVRRISGLPFGGTDCALPMIWAEQSGKKFDAFVVFTDSETWAGNIHPSQALKSYRSSSGIKDAKLIVNGMTATGFTIADPKDPNTLDVVGFDTAAPSLMADFIRG